MGSVRTLAPALSLLLLLSGCTAAQGAAKETRQSSEPPPPAPVPTITTETGSVAGLVVDPEFQPLVDAQVALQEPGNVTARTDASGKFTFNEIDPGSYTVVAQKLGYESAGRKVTVLAGEVVEVQLTLSPILVAEPYHEMWIDDGYIHLSVWTWVVGVNPTIILDDKRSFTHNVSVGLAAVVGELRWDASAPGTARYLFLTENVAANKFRNSTQGRSPVITRVDEIDLKKAAKLNVTWGLAFPCPTLSTACVEIWTGDPVSVFQVAFEQRVKIHTTAFYYQPAPSDYTGLPR